MTFPLSKGVQILLVRVFFFVLVLSSAYGIYDNRDFLTTFPFYITAVLDTLFALFFLYAVTFLPKLIRSKKTLVLRTFLAFWAYTITINLGSLGLYVRNLGTEKVAEASGYSFSFYIFYEVTYLAILPSIAFGLIAWIIYKIN